MLPANTTFPCFCHACDIRTVGLLHKVVTDGIVVAQAVTKWYCCQEVWPLPLPQSVAAGNRPPCVAQGKPKVSCCLYVLHGVPKIVSSVAQHMQFVVSHSLVHRSTVSQAYLTGSSWYEGRSKRLAWVIVSQPGPKTFLVCGQLGLRPQGGIAVTGGIGVDVFLFP